jgi:hypothetical protein
MAEKKGAPMKRKVTLLWMVVVHLLTACGTNVAVEWKPPMLPIALVFSEAGVRLELDLGIDIPYLGTVSLTAPIAEIPTGYPALFVTLNGETHQYDISSQSNNKFNGIVCRTGCEISIELMQNGSIHLDVKNFNSARDAVVIPYSGNFTTTLVILPENLNIREGPGTEYEEIGGAYQGDILMSDGTTEISTSGGVWYRVLVPPGNYGSGQEGWVSAKYVQVR